MPFVLSFQFFVSASVGGDGSGCGDGSEGGDIGKNDGISIDKSEKHVCALFVTLVYSLLVSGGDGDDDNGCGSVNYCGENGSL